MSEAFDTLPSAEQLHSLREHHPHRCGELAQALQIAVQCVNGIVNELQDEVGDTFRQRNFSATRELTALAETAAYLEETLKTLAEGLFVESAVNRIQVETSPTVEEDEESRLGPIDYERYAVDHTKPHSLEEVFTYKRPYGFRFRNKNFTCSTWVEVLVQTCRELQLTNFQMFNDATKDPTLNGENPHFARSSKNMRKPVQIHDGVWIETNLSAENIRKTIKRLLEKLGFRTTDYIVFFKADYARLAEERSKQSE